MKTRSNFRTAALTVLLTVCTTASSRAGVTVTNLVTNNQALNPALLTDTDLVNPWGASFSSGSPFWVSDNATGKATLYTVNPTTNAPVKSALAVTIPGEGSVTGQVFSANASFNADTFLFVSEDGTVSGWRNALGTTAEVLTVGSSANVYKGSTTEIVSGNTYLLGANFHAGTIDVIKGSAALPNLTGTFQDPSLPAGYAPFNIANLGGKIYVTYALQDATGHDDVAGGGHGYVDSYDLAGNFVSRVASAASLNSPWGLTLAPAGFQNVGGDLLVGNFGNGTINASDGPVLDTLGNPVHIDGLWTLTTGNGGNAGSPGKVYFTAGPDGESAGLLGTLSVPEPSSLTVVMLGVAALSRRRSRVA